MKLPLIAGDEALKTRTEVTLTSSDFEISVDVPESEVSFVKDLSVYP
jgi:hypothetical protein